MTDAPTKEMRLNADRLMELKQSPRSADVTDIEDLCDEVERLRTVLETIANYSGKTEPALLLKYLAEAALKSPAETGAKPDPESDLCRSGHHELCTGCGCYCHPEAKP